MIKIYEQITWEELEEFEGIGIRRTRKRGDRAVCEAHPEVAQFCPTGPTGRVISNAGGTRTYVGEIKYTIDTPFLYANKKGDLYIFMAGGKVEKYSPKKHKDSISPDAAAIARSGSSVKSLGKALAKKKARVFKTEGGRTVIMIGDRIAEIGCKEGYDILKRHGIIDEKGWVLSVEIPEELTSSYEETTAVICRLL